MSILIGNGEITGSIEAQEGKQKISLSESKAQEKEKEEEAQQLRRVRGGRDGGGQQGQRQWRRKRGNSVSFVFDRYVGVTGLY